MATVAIILNGHGFGLECIMETNPIRVSYIALCKALIHCNSHLKQLYSSNKTLHFSYKGGCGVREHTHIEAFKRRAGLV